MNKHKIPNGGQKRTLLGGPKEKKARKAFQKAMMGSIRVVFALTSRHRRKQGLGKGPTRKKQGGTCPQSGLSASETPNEEGYGHAWEPDDWSASHWTGDSLDSRCWVVLHKAHTAWMAATPLNLANHPTHVVLDLGCTRSIGSRSAIGRFKKHAWYHGITTEFCPCNKSFVFANSQTETCKDSCIIHFPTTPPCSTKVDVLETGDVPILFSLSQMKNLGAFGLYFSPPEYSTMRHIVLDLTNLAYQSTTTSREKPGHPRRHVTFAMSERKPSISSSCTRHA